MSPLVLVLRALVVQAVHRDRLVVIPPSGHSWLDLVLAESSALVATAVGGQLEAQLRRRALMEQPRPCPLGLGSLTVVEVAAVVRRADRLVETVAAPGMIPTKLKLAALEEQPMAASLAVEVVEHHSSALVERVVARTPRVPPLLHTVLEGAEAVPKTRRVERELVASSSSSGGDRNGGSDDGRVCFC
jgi:hypothetical protein